MSIQIYTRKLEEDVLITNWWLELLRTGDLYRLLPPASQSLGQLMRILSYPTVLFYALEGERIWCAIWLRETEFSKQVVHLSAWAAKEKRGTRDHFYITDTIFQKVFEHDVTVISVTSQREILALQEKMGYTIHSKIPRILAGEDGWVSYLTREDYEKAIQPIRLRMEKRHGKDTIGEHSSSERGRTRGAQHGEVETGHDFRC